MIERTAEGACGLDGDALACVDNALLKQMRPNDVISMEDSPSHQTGCIELMWLARNHSLFALHLGFQYN